MKICWCMITLKLWSNSFLDHPWFNHVIQYVFSIHSNYITPHFICLFAFIRTLWCSRSKVLNSLCRKWPRLFENFFLLDGTSPITDISHLLSVVELCPLQSRYDLCFSLDQWLARFSIPFSYLLNSCLDLTTTDKILQKLVHNEIFCMCTNQVNYLVIHREFDWTDGILIELSQNGSFKLLI
jgi:hypothetical protein